MTKAIKAALSASLLLGLQVPVSALASNDLQKQVDDLSKQVTALQQQLNKVGAKASATPHATKASKKQSKHGRKRAENFTDSVGDDNYQAASVTTSPTLGLRSAHHGQDLVVNFSSLNEDLRLLEQRQKFQKQRGVAELSRPLVEISGVLRGDIEYDRNFAGNSTTDLDLVEAEVDLFAEASRWVSGFMSLAYDNGMPTYDVQSVAPGQGYNNLSWSNIYLKRGFITLGDLTQKPVYGSIGQMYMPFGKYSTWLVSSPLTKKLGRTSGRGIDIGYKGDKFVATGFVMHGDVREVANSDGSSALNDNLNAWGGNVETSVDLAKSSKLTVGAGYTNNIADSEGILSVLEYATKTFTSSISYNIQNFVPAYDVYAKLEFGDNWIVNAEYINARKDIIADVGAGYNLGQPRAYHVELDHLAYAGPLPLAMGIGYGHTDGFQYLPQDSYQVAVSTYLWKDTVQSLEYRHLRAYPGTESTAIYSRNYVTALFSMYF